MEAFFAYGNASTRYGGTMTQGADGFTPTLPVTNLRHQHLTKIARTIGPAGDVNIVSPDLIAPNVFALGNTNLTPQATVSITANQGGQWVLSGTGGKTFLTRAPATEFTEVSIGSSIDIFAATEFTHSGTRYYGLAAPLPLTKLRSINGVTWEDPSAGQDAGGNATIGWNNGTADFWTIVGDNGRSDNSNDGGVTWNSGNLPASFDGKGIGAIKSSSTGNERVLAVGVASGNAAIHYSDMGVIWFVETVPAVAGILRGCAGKEEVAVAVGDGAMIMRKGSFTAAWDQVAAGNIPTSEDLTAVTVDPNGVFVAVGKNGTILTSADGNSWTLRSGNIGVDLLGVAVGYDSTQKAVFLAVGQQGRTAYSEDGVIWTPGLAPTPTDFRCVAFNRDGFSQQALSGALQVDTVRRLAVMALNEAVPAQAWSIRIEDTTLRQWEAGLLFLGPWVQPAISTSAPFAIEILDDSIVEESIGHQLMTYRGGQRRAIEPFWDALERTEAYAQFVREADRLSGRFDHVIFARDLDLPDWGEETIIGRVQRLGPAIRLGPDYYNKRYRIVEGSTQT